MDTHKPLDWSVVYVGSVGGMEAGLVASESDLPYRAIPAAALRGRGVRALARNGLTMVRGVQAAHRLIAELRPAAILGTGGYVCGPLFLAAWMARVPTAIYLPDVVPGLAVRFLAQIATRVACNVEDSARYLRFSRSKISVTGYPVRQELFEQDKATSRAAFGLSDRLPVLFVYGGSLGARSINQAIAALLEHLLPLSAIIHVCGRADDEAFLRATVARLPEELQARYTLFPYLYSKKEGFPSMLKAFGAADLAICRSGASTLGELPAAGLPAVLVPYPYVHQEENADYLVRHGAALRVQDAEMLGSGRPEEGPLFRHVRHLLEDSHARAAMSERSRALARADAPQQLAGILIDLATRRSPA